MTVIPLVPPYLQEDVRDIMEQHDHYPNAREVHVVGVCQQESGDYMMDHAL
jgi:hypothetical protein